MVPKVFNLHRIGNILEGAFRSRGSTKNPTKETRSRKLSKIFIIRTSFKIGTSLHTKQEDDQSSTNDHFKEFK